MKEKNFVSAVVYIKNAENEIENFVVNLNKVLNKHFLHYEIILVNDGSVDNSILKIKEISSKVTGSVSLINMSHYQGRELSMNAGVDLSIGDFVYEFDNIYIDYDIETIFNIYKKSLEGYDIVSASSSSKRRFTSKLFYNIFNKYSNYEYSIGTESFRIISRRAINRVHQINKTIPYRKAVFANCGLKMFNFKYNPLNKTNKKIEKYEKNERQNNAFDSLILFTDISYKLSMWLILFFIILTLFVSGYTIYNFVINNSIKGWTTTMLFLCFGFLGLFIILSIIIKYLSVIINLIFKKANYLVESIEKLN